ncbi:MAG: carbohydrate ABC transporter substrate-binding protein [Alphaproteobacteria bacterium]|nr:carbohydrate ABC transporter substrate-binding protein [Alphaproteobacteria bacterium]
MTRSLTRRRALATGAGAALLPLVHVGGAHAAGSLAVGFWDHWVPQGNDVMKKQATAWAEKNKVDLQADFITGNGNKLLMTRAAEAQARTGHDMLAFQTWDIHQYADRLEPVDDVMGHLIAQYGQTNEICEYLGRIGGHWGAVPTSSGTQIKGPCGRISLLNQIAGLDVVGMYPARPEHTAAADGWTYDAMLKAMAACKKANVPFGIGLGLTVDSTDSAGALFAAFGAELVDGEGNLKVRSEPVHRLLEYAQQMVKFLPADAISYDDASNNRALISGKSALIFNPPSAWAVAKRDNPTIAADCWTFPAPRGVKGRFAPYLPFFWGVWSFSKNKSAAKDLIAYLSERAQVEERCNVVEGFDLPPFDSMLDFKIWEEVEPPKGTIYNYPLRKWHDARPTFAASWAAPDVAVQIYNRGTLPTMFAKLMTGSSIEQTMAWAESEVQGFLR